MARTGHTRARRPDQVDSRTHSLIVRGQEARSQMLSSTFVTLYEPTGEAFVPLRRVGRVSAAAGIVAVVVESVDGVEYVLVNMEPGSVQRVTSRRAVRLARWSSHAGAQREIVLAGAPSARMAPKQSCTRILLLRLKCPYTT